MPESPQRSLPIPQSEARLNQTILTGRRHVAEHRAEGVRCPCCDQWAKEYRRKLNAGMAATLIALWSATLERESFGNRDPWFHIDRDLVGKGRAPARCRDFSVLKAWGLIEPKPVAPGAVHSGFWAITARGRMVCRNPKAQWLRKYVVLYNGQHLRFEGPMISVMQALDSKFDFGELMANAKEEA